MRLNPGRMFSFVQIKSQTLTEREEGRRLPTKASLTQPGAQTVRRTPDWKPRWSSAGKCTPPRLNAARLTPKKVPQTLDPPWLLNPSHSPIFNLHLRLGLFSIILLSNFPARFLSSSIGNRSKEPHLVFLLIQHPAWGISTQKKRMNEACFPDTSFVREHLCNHLLLRILSP